MNQVFVTGGTGFVGAYLLHYLVRRGDKVRAMRRKNSPMELVSAIADQIEWVEVELSDLRGLEDAMRGVDHLYHAAAMVSFDPKDADKMFKINIEGTANIVDAALSAGVKKMLHVSSIAALGRKEGRVWVDEKAPWENTKQNSNYAISKFKAECEVWRGIEEGLQAVIINPSMILGAGYWAVGSNHFFNQMYKGFRFYPIGSTGFVDVRDVARSAVELIDSPISGERFILNAENWTYRHFSERVCFHLQRKAPTVRLSPFLAGLVWRSEAVLSRLMGRPPVITRDVIQTIQTPREYGNEKLIKALHFQYIPIEQTIAQTAALFLQGKQSNATWAMLPVTE